MRRPIYVSRQLIDGPWIGLCLSEEAFTSELKRLKIPERKRPLSAVSEGADATTHVLEGPGGMVFLVCMRRDKRQSKIQRYALLMHEAVHIWQSWARSIGEIDPSLEFEAYAIQGISQRLMEAFDR